VLTLENLTAINALEQAFATQFQAEVKQRDYERSVAYGQAVADAILAWAAAVLTAMFGIKAFTDTPHVDHHLMPLQEPHSFSSFDEAAQEAAASRLYGGIHFPFDNEDGLSAGQCIGRATIEGVRFRDGDND
jgi:hypothetical protein